MDDMQDKKTDELVGLSVLIRAEQRAYLDLLVARRRSTPGDQTSLGDIVREVLDYFWDSHETPNCADKSNAR
jgi:hypothetical protein